MRIGILTYHRSNNYGAFMQAYSLSTRLKKDFPDCEVSIIDYMSKEVYYIYNKSIKGLIYLVINAKPLRRKLSYMRLYLADYKKKKANSLQSVDDAFFEEGRKQLLLSPETIITDNYRTISNYINKNFDIVVVGSDAVWNWQIRPFPNVYFLGDKIKTKKLSYAASSYAQPFKNLSDAVKNEINNSWSSFDYLGVRDNITEDFVKFINPKLKPHHNCDPTVFLDINNLPVDKEIVRLKLIEAGFNPNKKAIGIMAHSWLARLVKNSLGDEYQIISVYNKNEYADVNLLNLNPFEWASAFSFFDLTITNYFHGNLLSLKNGTPTLIVEQKSDYNQDYQSKIRDLMTRIDLLDYCYYSDEINEVSLHEKVDGILNNKDILKHKIKQRMMKEGEVFGCFEEALKQLI